MKMAMNKKTVVAILMMVAVLMAFAATSCEATEDCTKACMPVCLKTEGASVPACNRACAEYCRQVDRAQES
ncbi:hypothetical protein BT93_K0617 [Corymbia citriodora subsp. variegata]|nr:hypothetical protein BT93_K0617 [Corymbia citriodora subsp. variegata]